MKRQVCWAALVAWVVGAGVVWAQTPVGTAFTYQGRLMDGGVAANGTYDLRCILYDASVGGSQVGPIVNVDDVAVSDGYFTAELDFGTGVFAGNACFLEIGVRPGASTGAYTVLSERQELVPTPHAVWSSSAPWSGLSGVPAGFADDVDDDSLGALSCSTDQVAQWNGSAWVCTTEVAGVPWTGVSGKPAGFADDVDDDSGGTVTSITAGIGLTGGTITTSGTIEVDFGTSGTTVATGDHNHFGQSWSGTGDGLQVTTSSDYSFGVYGHATATSSGSVGLYGISDSTEGAAVLGQATATSGNTWGVYGQSNSTEGFGVFGEAYYGVYGSSSSSSGYGVYGMANAASGTNYGVYGQSISTSGTSYGVYGRSASTSGRGVYGYVLRTSGNTWGVYGESASSTGRGVYGLASATSGINYGVRGASSSTAGFDFFASGAGTDYGALSSIRWKRDIRVIDSALEKAQQLRGVYFTWDEEHGGHPDVGMVAEEVGKVLPEIVQYEENGTDAMGMDYSRLTPLLVEAIKEQQSIVKAQQKIVEEQRKVIADLKRRVAVLEQKIE